MQKVKMSISRLVSLIMVLTVCMSLVVLPVSAKQNAAAEAANAVVRILIMNPVTGEPAGFGSAFGIGANEGDAPEYFVTNKHVIYAKIPTKEEPVTDEDYVTLPAVQIFIMKSDMALTYSALQQTYAVEPSQVIPCEVVYESDGNPDMAILRAAEPYTGRTTLPLRIPAEDKDRSETVYALGFPGLNDDTNINYDKYSQVFPADVEDVSITRGVFSHMAPMKTYDNYVHIEHDARISNGNSGGPLIDENGAVIGINTYSYTNYTSTAYYAVSSQYIVSACDQLNIPYRLAGAASSNSLRIALIAVGVIAVCVVLIILLKKRKDKEEKIVVNTRSTIPNSPAGIQIRAESGVFAGKTMMVTATVQFGRKTGVNQVCFPDGTGGVSGEHCKIYLDNTSGLYYLVDLNSTYGTYLNNQKLTPNVPVALQRGMVFYLGSQEQMFRVV